MSLKKWHKALISYGFPLLVLLIVWYITLIPLSFQSLEFWFCLFTYIAASTVIWLILNGREGTGVFKFSSALIAMGIVVIIIGSVSGSAIFRSKGYANILTYAEGDFEEDLTNKDPANIPTIDRDMAERLGSRKIGEVLNLVSQFDVSNEYTQIAYQGKSVRVSPLQYVGFFRWLTNRSEGIPYYITVDMVSGESELVDLKENIRYSHSGFFNDDINRHIFLHYPTVLFENPAFELDEEGNPYYIAPIIKKRFSFLGPTDVIGAFVVDATNGDIKKYDLKDIPDWVDRVYPADMVMRHINYNGMYQNGFLNSLITKKGVIQNAEGYNYIVLNDDLYLYTGLTSVVSDESNIGFTLVNSRTKEAKRYNLSTATEWSAMESAQGSVQEKGYISTFPLLFRMEGRPVYLLSLKDEAGLIKLYAFVDATNYQKVGISNSLVGAWNNFTGGVISSPSGEEVEPSVEKQSISGKIATIAEVVLDGETTYFFTLEGSDEVIYTVKVSVNKQLPFIQAGDTVKIEVSGTEVIRFIKE